MCLHRIYVSAKLERLENVNLRIDSREISERRCKVSLTSRFVRRSPWQGYPIDIRLTETSCLASVTDFFHLIQASQFSKV